MGIQNITVTLVRSARQGGPVRPADPRQRFPERVGRGWRIWAVADSLNYGGHMPAQNRFPATRPMARCPNGLSRREHDRLSFSAGTASPTDAETGIYAWFPPLARNPEDSLTPIPMPLRDGWLANRRAPRHRCRSGCMGSRHRRRPIKEPAVFGWGDSSRCSAWPGRPRAKGCRAGAVWPAVVSGGPWIQCRFPRRIRDPGSSACAIGGWLAAARGSRTAVQ